MPSENAVTIHIYEDRKCSKCGKPGATDSGVCLRCWAKFLGTDKGREWMRKTMGSSLDAVKPQRLP